MIWKGYYINLDRAVARRSSIERQIEDHNLGRFYSRFAAIDGRLLKTSSSRSPAEVGIYRSHLELIRKAASTSHITHIIEDDVKLNKYVEVFVSGIACNSGLDFDILVTDTGFRYDEAKKFRSFRRQLPNTQEDGSVKFKLIDITNIYRWGMTSYILSPTGARKFLELAEEEWNRGPGVPIDVLLRRAAQANRLRILCCLPFLTWLNMEDARRTLSDRDQNHFVATVQQLLRYPLYIERDMKGYFSELVREVLKSSEDYPSRPETVKALEAAEFLLNQCEL